MAESEKQLRIAISTTADTSGALEAQKAIEGVVAATKQAAEAQKALTAAQEDADSHEGGGGSSGAQDAQRQESERRAREEATLDGLERIRVAQERVTDAIQDTADEAQKTKEEFEAIADAADDAAEAIEKASEKEASGGDDKGGKGAKRAEMLGMIGEGIGKVAGLARSFAKDMEGLDEASAKTWNNVADGAEVASATLTGAATGFSVGGPLGAAIGGLAGLASGVLGNAFDDMTASLKSAAEGAKNAKQWEEALAKAIKDRNTEIQNSRATTSYQRELSVLKEQTEEMRLQKAVRGAKDDADDAIGALEDQKAIMAGGSETEVKSNRIKTNADKKVGALDQNIKDKGEELYISESAVVSAQFLLDSAIRNNGESSKEATDAAEKVKAGEQETEKIRSDIKVMQGKRGQEVAKIAAESEIALNEVTKTASAKQVEALQAGIESLDTLGREGASISTTANAAYAEAKALLKDNIPDSQQGQEIAQAAQKLTQGITSNNQVVLQALQKSAADAAAMRTQMKEIEKLINQLQY